MTIHGDNFELLQIPYPPDSAHVQCVIYFDII